MANLKPESLKRIAEALGWTDVHIVESVETVVFAVPVDCTYEEIFNPQNNPAQLLEIIEKFKIDVEHSTDAVLASNLTGTKYIEMEASTLTEAVLAAAEEYVK